MSNYQRYYPTPRAGRQSQRQSAFHPYGTRYAGRFQEQSSVSDELSTSLYDPSTMGGPGSFQFPSELSSIYSDIGSISEWDDPDYEPVVPGKPRAEDTNMPNVRNEGRGESEVVSKEDPAYDFVLDTASDKFGEMLTNIDTIVLLLYTMPPQMRTSSAVGSILEGIPLGFLVMKIHQYILSQGGNEEEAEEFIQGLYVSGIVQNFQFSHENGEIELDVIGKRIVEWPLSKVSYFGAAQRHEVTSLIHYIDSIRHRPTGSDASTYIMMSDVSFSRRTLPNFMMSNRGLRSLRVVRTGGFSNVLYEDTVKSMYVRGKEYLVYIPSGDGNCFERCIEWTYVEAKGAENCVELCLNDELYHDGVPVRDRLKREVQQVIQKGVEFATTTSKGRSAHVSKLGYTNQVMKKISKTCFANGIYMTCVYKDRSKFVNICEDHSMIRQGVTLFMTRVNCFGNIHATKKKANGAEVFHCIGIHPHPSAQELDECSFVEEFTKALEYVTQRVMAKYYMEARYDKDVDDYSLERLVEFQKQRYERRDTNTLIFDKKEYAWKPVYKPGESPNVYVFAYDLETVCNRSDNQHMVWEPFRKESGLYDPIESQIPFSAQWVPVNVSDCEEYARAKDEQGVPILTYETPAVSDVIDDNGKYKRFHDVMLDDVVTEYGDKQLGKCVEDMCLHIAEYIHVRGGKTAYLYAHNGVGFDSYVCLQFNRFKVTRLLKTPRGILSMSIRVPVGSGDEMVTLVFRDTKVQVPGSLSSLCKCFGVPKDWCKLEFPIAMINSKSCYADEVLKVSKPYGENDVKSLAYIVKAINDSYGTLEWEPCNVKSEKPPITQFLTTMSMVKASTYNHFTKTLGRSILPKAVDLPALRHWLVEATNGGRVNAYARTFVHYLWSDIVGAYLRNDKEKLKEHHKTILDNQSGMQVLDVTSLYPDAQSQCPMPTGELYPIEKEECLDLINAIYCEECERLYTLCEKHKGPQAECRPFAIILVKGCIPSKEHPYDCTVGRKVYGCTKSEGLVYSLETPYEVNTRKGRSGAMNDIQAYSNVDLYWMFRQGYDYQVIGGFGWKTSMDYNSFIVPAFEKRIQAKKDGNKVLSNSLKLMYNSTYGVTCQKDIEDSSFIHTLPDHLKEFGYENEHVIRSVNDKHTNVEPDEELKDSILLKSGQTYFLKQKKAEHFEVYGDQSPMQIGCAVLSWSRHIMNLFMMAFPIRTNQTYTDTDSDAMADKIIQQHLKKTPGLVNNAADAVLGSLKNDHLEGPYGEPNGKEPRVVLSLIGTKKVKMHVTLNEEGELKVFNTFKGMNISHTLDGVRMHPDYAAHKTSMLLVDINESGRADPVTVTNWSRKISSGIQIEDHEQESYSKTYLGHSAGQTMVKDEFGNLFEVFIPHGVPVDEFVKDHFTDFYYATNNRTGEMGLRTRLAGDFEWCYHRRKKTLEENNFLHDVVRFFLDKYYAHCSEEYTVESDEYKNVVTLLRSYN